MTKDEFAAFASANGYGAPAPVGLDANAERAMHTHDDMLLVYVVSGRFILKTEHEAVEHGPGETCAVDAGTRHAEAAGPDGAQILVARKDLPV
jgi:quercetin dioxygenase-like cupin family protein